MIPPFLFRCLETGLETERGKDEGKEKRGDKVVKLIDDGTESGRETNVTASEEYKSDIDTLQRVRRTDKHKEEKVTSTFTSRAFSRRLCPKGLTISRFVTREKTRHHQRWSKRNIETMFKPSSGQRFFMCISAVKEVRQNECTSA